MPSLDAAPSGAASAALAAEQARAASRDAIEQQLAGAAIAWRGLERVSRGAGAAGDAPAGSLVEQRSPRQLAAELEALPLGARAALVSEDGREWMVLRDEKGVRLAPEGTPAAAALLETHLTRGDLSFAGVRVEARGELLRVVDFAPPASAASALGLTQGDVVLGAVPARGVLPLSSEPLGALRVARGVDERSVEAMQGDPALRESLDALRRRLTGLPVPVEHWLTRAGVPAGALLVSASIGSSAAWSADSDLRSLDAVLERARAVKERLTVQLVTAEGLERRVLVPTAEGVTEVAEGRRVAVALTSHAPRGSAVQALLAAGAPYGFEVDVAVEDGAASLRGAERDATRTTAAGAAGPAEPSSAPSAQAVAYYRAISEGYLANVRAMPEAAQRRGPEAVASFEAMSQAMLPYARAQLEGLEAYAGALAQLPLHADERTIAEHLARVEEAHARAEERLRAELENERRDAIADGLAGQAGLEGDEAPVGPDRRALARALVEAATTVAEDQRLSVAERHRRIDELSRGALAKAWFGSDDGAPLSIEEVRTALRKIVSEPAPREPAEATAQAGAATERDGELEQPPDDALKLLRSRIAHLAGSADALWATADGEPESLGRLEERFIQAARARPSETVRAHAEALAGLAAELSAAGAALRQELDGPERLSACVLISWLSGPALEKVRRGLEAPASALELVAAHRQLVDEQFGRVDGTPSARREATPESRSVGRPFGSRAELEAYLDGLAPGRAARLYAPGQRSFLDAFKRSAQSWHVQRGWLETAAGAQQAPSGTSRK